MSKGPLSTLRSLDELRAQAIILDNGWHRWPPPYQMMSIALEEANLLYALVRATRPRNVLELGTGLGISARFIGQALQDNGAGHLLTVEPLEEIGLQAVDFLEGLPVTLTQSLDAIDLLAAPDLVYIDSGYDHRPADLREWLGGGYGGLVVVHDADRGYPELKLGVGVTVGTANGMWIGKAK